MRLINHAFLLYVGSMLSPRLYFQNHTCHSQFYKSHQYFYQHRNIYFFKILKLIVFSFKFKIIIIGFQKIKLNSEFSSRSRTCEIKNIMPSEAPLSQTQELPGDNKMTADDMISKLAKKIFFFWIMKFPQNNRNWYDFHGFDSLSKKYYNFVNECVH